MKYKGQTDYDHKGISPRRGVLLCNLGTPDAPDKASLKRYLKEFLSDPRVVEVPRPIWWMILHGVILNIRPAKSAKLYQSVWTEEGSPLMVHSLHQQKKLQTLLDKEHGENHIPVVLGMRYGNPSIASALDQLAAQNVREIIVLPLYPQYSGATGGSTFDALAEHFKTTRWVPGLHFINGYHNHSAYIEALCRSLEADLSDNAAPDLYLFSYHGTPERYLKQGDPYHCFCHQTTRLVRERMGWDEAKVKTTFQSRFGREPWLQPYTDKTLEALPSTGVKNVAVICPGFSSDCLETIEEINEEARETFLESGGESFRYIPALNSDDAHIEMMARLVAPYLNA